jgi:hypothetical protein
MHEMRSPTPDAEHLIRVIRHATVPESVTVGLTSANNQSGASQQIGYGVVHRRRCSTTINDRRDTSDCFAPVSSVVQRLETGPAANTQASRGEPLEGTRR